MDKLELGLQQIRKIETPKLHKALAKWRSIKFESTMFIYGELVHRGERISESSKIELQTLYQLKGFQNLEDLFSDYLRKQNCGSYEELLLQNGIVVDAQVDTLEQTDASMLNTYSSVGVVEKSSNITESKSDVDTSKGINDTVERIERIKELNGLKTSGAISEEEYQILKANLITSAKSTGNSTTVQAVEVVDSKDKTPDSIKHVSKSERNLNGIQYWWSCFEKYGTFSGRARRKEYWYFVLFNYVFSFALGFIDGYNGNVDPDFGLGPLGGIYTVISLLPGLAVTVRRLHDTGKSGWMLLLVFLPIIGWIWLFVLTVTEGDAGQNDYGPNPKGVGV